MPPSGADAIAWSARRTSGCSPPWRSERRGACALRLRLVAQERRDLGIRGKLGQFLRRRQLRLVTRRVDHAEKAERLALGGTELMPGHRRHGDEVASVNGAHFI